MDLRIRLLITAAMLCHLIVAPRLVTSQLPPQPRQTSSHGSGSYLDRSSAAITIQAERQECTRQICKLSGSAEIDYGIYRFKADELTYNRESGEAEAEGHLLLEGGPNQEHIEATRGVYNVVTEVGRFEHVRGSIGLTLGQRRSLILNSNPFSFTGSVVEKTGPDHYRVISGTITTCELPRPKWEFHFRKVVVEAGGNATIYHTSFYLEGVPILYLPFATHPVEKQARKSGFLIPNIGRSSTRGYTVGESVFWAINRSLDLHAGAEYFSRRGWAPDGELRARPSDNSFLDLTYFSVFDRGLNGVRQGGTEVHLNSEEAFAHNFRGVANIDYLSSYVFRLAFSDVFAQAVNSEVKSEAFLSNTTGSLYLNATTRRYQDFQSTTPGDVITILHAPGFELSSLEHRLGALPLDGRLEASAEGLSRSEPAFSTAPLVGRFDLNPAISLPLLFRGWSFRPSLSLRDTIYTQQLVPSSGIALTDVGTAISKTLNRKSLEGAFELRPPALDRVFAEHFGRRWKHVIEPRVMYTYMTGVENFPHILRFDERDILSDDNEIEYAVVHRLYAKPLVSRSEVCEPEGMPALLVGAPAPPTRLPWERSDHPGEQPCRREEAAAREVVTWELAQKYFLDPSFGGALVPGRRNVFTSTVDLTGIAFLTRPRHLSPLVSRLRVSTSRRNELEWDMDYDFQAGRVNTSTLLFNHQLGLFTLGAGNAFLHVPGQVSATSGVPADQKFNQYRAVLGYGSPGKRGFSGAVNLGLDARITQIQYGSAQLAYNWDCCGVNIEYRRFALASVRNENQFRFTFALANVGAFGNLRRGERLF
ncbi:MAG: LPS-assembly protein LptD [Acidobacteria bacterium]|nr:LPS-assembly protein LptD [Acidobacteriota bacterium]